MNSLSEPKEQSTLENNLLRLHLICKTGFTVDETDAVLHYIIVDRIQRRHCLIIKNDFKKNTLLCRQVINRFATEHKIRYEDALDVLAEWALIDF
jgi:hypothetical protein